MQIQSILPEGVRYRDYGGDLILEGKNLNQEIFKKIMGTLPSTLRARVIGWTSLAGNQVLN